MKNPFKISFKRELSNLNKDEIIELFLINLRGTLYQTIEKESETKVVIKGEFFSLNPLKNVPWNLWTGFSRKAELNLTNDNLVVYTIDFKYSIISALFVILYIIFSDFLFSFPIDYVFWVVILSFLLISIIVKLLLQRQIFIKTIRLENKFKGDYDWNELFKNKSDSELDKIAKGNTMLTLEVQKMAKDELNRRTKK